MGLAVGAVAIFPCAAGLCSLFVPRKKAWERRCARLQAPERWPGRLFAIKLHINDGFGMFFAVF